MPIDIDPETMNVDDLPGIWSPVQSELSEDERMEELELQSTASLLFAVDAPEAILRLLLEETQIERTYDPPPGFDPNLQGEWDPEIVTFKFARPIKLLKIDRQRDYLRVEYDLDGLGGWAFEIEPDKVNIRRL